MEQLGLRRLLQLRSLNSFKTDIASRPTRPSQLLVHGKPCPVIRWVNAGGSVDLWDNGIALLWAYTKWPCTACYKIPADFTPRITCGNHWAITSLCIYRPQPSSAICAYTHGGYMARLWLGSFTGGLQQLFCACVLCCCLSTADVVDSLVFIIQRSCPSALGCMQLPKLIRTRLRRETAQLSSFR